MGRFFPYGVAVGMKCDPPPDDWDLGTTVTDDHRFFHLEPGKRAERNIMKDKRGVYYHPYPKNRSIRMYVRQTVMGVEFRMWNKDDPELWKAHGWLPYDAIVEAQKMYTGQRFNPSDAYDLDIASAVIREHG